MSNPLLNIYILKYYNKILFWIKKASSQKVINICKLFENERVVSEN